MPNPDARQTPMPNPWTASRQPSWLQAGTGDAIQRARQARSHQGRRARVQMLKLNLSIYIHCNMNYMKIMWTNQRYGLTGRVCFKVTATDAEKEQRCVSLLRQSPLKKCGEDTLVAKDIASGEDTESLYSANCSKFDGHSHHYWPPASDTHALCACRSPFVDWRSLCRNSSNQVLSRV